MIASRPLRAVRKHVALPLFLVSLREALAARYAGSVSRERVDENGELWSIDGLLISLDVLSEREIAVIMMDGAHPDYRCIRLDDRGLRDALEHIMELSARAAM